MDMRARLLFAFVPLLILLLVIAVAPPLINSRLATLRAARFELIADLLRSADLVQHVVLQHGAVAQLVGGKPGALDNYLRERAAVEQLLALESEREDPNQLYEQRIAALYSGLAQDHQESVALFEAQDRAGAARRFGQSQVGQLLDAIIDLGVESRAASSAALAEADAALQRFERNRAWAVLAATFVGMAGALALALILIQQVVTPLNRLAADAEQFATGDRAGQLSAVGNIAQVRRLREAFQQLIDANAARQSGLQAARDELEARITRELQLRETVHALSVPIVPLARDTLLLPLVGYLDEQRSSELTRSLLDAIQSRRARLVVLDLTGLAALDDATAERLRQTSEAARLLGCRVTLVGVRADQALTLIAFNLGAAGIAVARDIPAVLAATKDV